MPYHVYLLTNRKHGTLYVGVTNDLFRRVHEHRSGSASSFTKKHRLHRLVYASEFGQIDEAITMEKRLKRWKRAWKIQLVEQDNPDWIELLSER